MKDLSGQLMLEMIKAGDSKAFEMLLDRYSDPLFRHLIRKTGNRQEAEDMTQEIFLSFWKRRHSLKLSDDTSLRAYLYGAAIQVN